MYVFYFRKKLFELVPYHFTNWSFIIHLMAASFLHCYTFPSVIILFKFVLRGGFMISMSFSRTLYPHPWPREWLLRLLLLKVHLSLHSTSLIVTLCVIYIPSSC